MGPKTDHSWLVHLHFPWKATLPSHTWRLDGPKRKFIFQVAVGEGVPTSVSPSKHPQLDFQGPLAAKERLSGNQPGKKRDLQPD